VEFVATRRVPHIVETQVVEAGLQGGGRLGLAVHQDDAARPSAHGPGVGQQEIPTGVRRQSGDGDHLGAQVVTLSVDAHRRLPLQQSSAKRVGSHPRCQQHGVARILDGVLEVVQHAAALGHARAGDHDQRAAHGVDRLALLDVARVVEQVEAEGRPVRVALQEGACLVVEVVGECAEDLRHVCRQGAVDEDRQSR